MHLSALLENWLQSTLLSGVPQEWSAPTIVIMSNQAVERKAFITYRPSCHHHQSLLDAHKRKRRCGDKTAPGLTVYLRHTFW